MGILSPRSLRQSIIPESSVASGTDPYGNAIYTISALGSHPASVTLADESEDAVGRDTFTHTYNFVVMADCPIEGVDSVTWKGDTYEILSQPKAHLLPNGTVHHKEFTARRFDG